MIDDSSRRKRLAKHARRLRREPGEPNELPSEASYTCQSCGEVIVIPIDACAGHIQSYDEDCPVCCHPHVIHVEILDDGEARAWAESEEDLD